MRMRLIGLFWFMFRVSAQRPNLRHTKTQNKESEKVDVKCKMRMR